MSRRQPRLLIVDDDASAITVMSRMLAQYPDQRFATSGEDAIRLARESTPDVILLDADMPGMTGLDVCRVLKADPRLAQVPVIFATRLTAPLMEVAALELGAADFISKPLVASQVMARVQAQLRRTRRAGWAASAARPPGQARVPRLLIVDDDAGGVRLLRRTLSALGELHVAGSGTEALDLARRLGPDLILLGGLMPGMDGFDLCAVLRDEAALQHVPIVFVTRFPDPHNERRAFDLGAADFVAQPCAPAVLQARVRNLLNLKCSTDARLQEVYEHWRGVSDARVADIVRAASDAIVAHDAQGRVVLANAAACRMFDATLDDLLGGSIDDLLGTACTDLARDGMAWPATRITLLRPNATPLSVEAATSSVGTGPERLTTVILRDMSDRDRLEAESRARITAESASRTKTMLLSYLAHEIGNPLNAIMGFAQLMEADASHPLPPEQARRLEHVAASGRHLQALIRDLLDLGSLETGRLAVRLQPIEVGTAVVPAVKAVSALAGHSSIQLIWAETEMPSARVVADPGRLQQCLSNLLTNGIKYNRAGGWVRVEVDSRDDEVEIRVSDNGLGLTASQLEHLFEPFNRLGRQGGTVPGSGLGLVVTRQLVEAMHGTLSVASIAGQGSRFSIVLPRSPAGSETAADPCALQP